MSLYCRKTKPENLKLGFGSHQLAAGRPSPLSEGELRLQVAEIVTHPQYSRYVSLCSLSLNLIEYFLIFQLRHKMGEMQGKELWPR